MLNILLDPKDSSLNLHPKGRIFSPPPPPTPLSDLKRGLKVGVKGWISVLILSEAHIFYQPTLQPVHLYLISMKAIFSSTHAHTHVTGSWQMSILSVSHVWYVYYKSWRHSRYFFLKIFFFFFFFQNALILGALLPLRLHVSVSPRFWIQEKQWQRLQLAYWYGVSCQETKLYFDDSMSDEIITDAPSRANTAQLRPSEGKDKGTSNISHVRVVWGCRLNISSDLLVCWP